MNTASVLSLASRGGAAGAGGGARLAWRLLAGAVIAGGLLGGIYAVAVTTASSMAASFNAAETTRHARTVEFASAAILAGAEYRLRSPKAADPHDPPADRP